MNQGRFEEAARLLRETEVPRNADTHRMFGIHHDMKGDSRGAIREYRKGIVLCRTTPGCMPELFGALYFNTGVAAWKLRDYRASAEAYEEAFRADPDNIEARRWAAKARQLTR
jgi:tetratricopeptide (TPR) repeat protein